MRGWLDKEMTWLAPHDGKPGRPAVFSDAAIQFCLTNKVLFKLPLRQTTGMVASLLKMAGLDWAVPDYTTLCRRQKTLVVQIPYRRVDGPLNLLVNSTGIKFLGDGEWQTRKHGVQGRRQPLPGNGCGALRPSASASRPDTPTAKPQKSRSASPSSTASTHSAPPRSPAWADDNGERGCHASGGSYVTTPVHDMNPSQDLCNRAGWRPLWLLLMLN